MPRLAESSAARPLFIPTMLLDLVDYAFEIGVGTSLEKGNRVCYESVVRKRAMADRGRFPDAVAAIHSLLRPVAVAGPLTGTGTVTA